MIDLRGIILKIFSLMCVFMFMVGPVCAAELFTGIKQTAFNDVNLTTAANLTFAGTYDDVAVGVDGYNGGYIAWDEADASTYPGTITIQNPYSTANWSNAYKSNLHTHTTESDGSATPAQAISKYEEKGYDILAITDHDYVKTYAPTWPWTDYIEEDPSVVVSNGSMETSAFYPDLGDNGMLAVRANEISWTHDTGSFFNDVGYFTSPGGVTNFLNNITSKNGIAMFFHPGRYSYTSEWYNGYFSAYPNTLAGMEVFNNGDRYPNDNETWDGVNNGRTDMIWGYSGDDSHSLSQVGRNYNTHYMDGLTESALRENLLSGASTFSYTPSASGNAPVLTGVSVNGTTITLSATGETSIRWYNDTTGIIGTGDSIEISAIDSSFVRAVLINADGYTYTQPFKYGKSGIVAAYSLNGNARAAVGQDGTAVNVTWSGSYGDFSGVGSGITTGAMAAITSTGNYSIYIVEEHATDQYSVLFRNVLGTSDRNIVGLYTGDLLYAGKHTSSTYNLKYVSVPRNQINHIFYTYNNGTVSLDVNGVAATSTGNRYFSSSSLGAAIGQNRVASGDDTKNFAGKIYHVSAYDYVLSSSERVILREGFTGLAFQPASTWIGYSGATTSLGAGTYDYIDVVSTAGGTYDITVTGYFTEDTTLISDLTTIMYNNISIVHGPGRNYTDGTIVYPRASGYPSYPLLESNNTGASLTTNATHYIINTGDLTVGDMFIYNLSSYSGTETWTVSGNVYEDDGITPVSGAAVTIGTATDTTDAAGYYYFPEIINGTTYQATFSKTQYDTATLSFTADGADVVNPDVTMHWITEDQAQRRNMISLFMAIGGMLGAGLLIGAAVVFYKSISGKSEVSFKQIRELGFAAIFLVIFLLAVVMMGAAVYR